MERTTDQYSFFDWSGSMNNVMMDTLKQLYNLIWFCRKVQIPYEVYAFTNDYPRPAMYANKETFMNQKYDGRSQYNFAY